MHRRYPLAGAIGVVVILLMGSTRGEEPPVRADKESAAADRRRTSSAFADNLARDWPEASRMAAMDMQQKYGPPSGVTPTRIIWENKGPWKEIFVYKEEVPHDFPKPHTDVLLQSVGYRVPPEKFSELAKFDGSIIVERTRGTMAARCDKEGLNILALNLANDIVTGKKNVEEARHAYGEAAKQFTMGQKPPITQRLAFESSKMSGDKDVTVIPPQPGEAQPAGAREPAQKR